MYRVRRNVLPRSRLISQNTTMRAAGRSSQGIPLKRGEDSADVPMQIADSVEPAEELERWSAFHQAIPQLPDEEREVFLLTFNQG